MLAGGAWALLAGGALSVLLGLLAVQVPAPVVSPGPGDTTRVGR
jgi:hypothetical protein